MNRGIAVVGMACRYPDASSPAELWENVLARRQAFRRIPSERLNLDDYYAVDPQTPDRIYATEAALLTDYVFDRMHFRVAGSTFRSADMAHWLALHVAAEALADAGFPDAKGLPLDTTGVLLGNTLTGEFSRANSLRLRWPYVRRVVGAALRDAGWSVGQQHEFLAQLEERYKQPFPPVGEETLAGGLSNTIAGRICNHFNLKGGGYVIDGACASSLLAIANACSGLLAGDLDVAIAGGVDLSLDPFELVGFAKTGALAADKMRVYDARSAGFWPGEGCGFVVLMRLDDAIRLERRIYAVLRGWGVSSDGSGGITRPEFAGQVLAVQRAYQRAGFGVETVGYFEGHGTGTSVGDTTELRVLDHARRNAGAGLPPAVISSIKTNIGHTKAAAGVAGLIKAVMAVYTQVLPPMAACETPHPILNDAQPMLQVLQKGELWRSELPLRAGVSAMGFGGINTHLVLEAATAERRAGLSEREQALINTPQDCELFLLSAATPADLQQQIARLVQLAPHLSYAELADLAATLAATIDKQPLRAALVASTPDELLRGLSILQGWLADGVSTALDARVGVFLGNSKRPPRIGYLFPGQGAPVYLKGGALCDRFATVQQIYAQAALPTSGDGKATEVAQPAIVAAALAALRVLTQFGVRAEIAVGHSLGELVAYHWAGAYSADALLRIAAARGQAMGRLVHAQGAMASIAAGRRDVAWLCDEEDINIACLNTPRQTVIAGTATAVHAVVARAQARNLQATILPVSHAFHSPLVAAAVPALADCLNQEEFQPLQRSVVSTITGMHLEAAADLRALLCQQITGAVRFIDAATIADQAVDLWIEVGPGRILSGLVGDMFNAPAIATDAGGSSLRGLFQALGAVYVLGGAIQHTALFADRFTRTFALDRQPSFLANPCEYAPMYDPTGDEDDLSFPLARPVPALPVPSVPQNHQAAPVADTSAPSQASALELIRQLVAERVEMSIAAVREQDHVLRDLHLNSITVSQLVAEAARRLHLPPPLMPSEYANATIGGIAQALEQLQHSGVNRSVEDTIQQPAGVDTWIECFTVELLERSLMQHPRSSGERGVWQVMSAPEHPLAPALRQRFTSHIAGQGVIVCLPVQADESQVGLLLDAAHAVLATKTATHFVVVQHGNGGASVARTLHLERPAITTCVVDLPFDHPQAAEWVLAEVLAANGYVEAHYDGAGRRYEPVLHLLKHEAEYIGMPLGPEDVVLVTGGGKGITAECALAIATETGARLALLGRSDPAQDAELAANLERMRARSVDCQYIVADITDRTATHAAIAQIQATLGKITGFLHGAARNEPCLLNSLDEPTFRRTLAPKLDGVHNVLTGLDPAQLRMFVTFGSIIARTGLPGEADYGQANAWLTHLTERFQAAHPSCRCLAIEWSVWADVGMGVRLGRIEALQHAGITPIPLDTGLAILHRLLTQRLPQVAVVVTGRWGQLPTLRQEQPALPFLRFLERPCVHYPGLELVVEADLSVDTDPYLNDHVFRGERLVPAVVGLEAMAQAAIALTGGDAGIQFSAVSFDRPIVVAPTGTSTIRIAALRRTSDTVDVVIRSADTGFQVDHFRATCCVGRDEAVAQAMPTANQESNLITRELIPVDLDAAHDLYGGLFFHSGRFRRVQRYRQLATTACIVEIAPDAQATWFGAYLPPNLALGDPGARDAIIHAIQACVPHLTLLPTGIERLIVGSNITAGPWIVQARERLRDENIFIYDIDVHEADGQLREHWQGLRLQVVSGAAQAAPWVEPLLGPYIERRVPELIPGATLTAAIECNPSRDRRTRSDLAIQRALAQITTVWRRPDGKPEVASKRTVSAAHAEPLTLAVASQGMLGCDMEPVAARQPAIWRDLLGTERFTLAQVLATESHEDLNTAATRIWSASECLRKAGAQVDAPLVLAQVATDGWVVLNVGKLQIATFVARVRSSDTPLVLALLVQKDVNPTSTAPDQVPGLIQHSSGSNGVLQLH